MTTFRTRGGFGAGRVVIYDSMLDSLFTPGGDVWGFTKDVTSEAADLARFTSPRRSGKLAAAHRANPIPSSFGRRGSAAQVYNTAPHSLYVHGGTSGPIRPRRAKALAVGKQSLYGPIILKRSVRGQRANPWMQEAVEAVLLARGVPLA